MRHFYAVSHSRAYRGIYDYHKFSTRTSRDKWVNAGIGRKSVTRAELLRDQGAWHSEFLLEWENLDEHLAEWGNSPAANVTN